MGFKRSRHPEDQLSAFLDGELDSRARRAVERHVAACEACSLLLEELRATKTMLTALPDRQPPRSFVLGPEYAAARGAAEAGAPSYRKRSALTLIPAVALTVFLAVLVVDLTGSSQSGSNDFGTLLATKAEESRDASQPQRSAAPADQPGQAGAGSGGAVVTPFAGTPDAFAPQPATGQGPAATAETMADSAQGGADQQGAPAGGDVPSVQAREASDSGPSLLLILEVVAGVVFLASVFYLFVWPRLLSRGGNQ